ncbi:MAG TPA: hypothetical protein VFX38_01155, partial [Gammaproteobacteria bacterium]|nr:hypothetical protein [Gammaproteobacteria bacterium]
AYVFTDDNGIWSQTQKLVVSDGDTGDEFGWSVALDGRTALIGAPYALNDDGSFPGAAYVFTEFGGTWTQTQRLVPDNGVDYDSFGYSVALSGTTALIGAIYAGDDLNGAAYVFDKVDGSWHQRIELAPGDGSLFGGDEFGYSVAVGGDTAIVGAIFAGLNAYDAHEGAAYVFSDANGEWDQTQKLSAGDATSDGFFGGSVALSDATALISAGGQGSAYIFNESDGVWAQTQELVLRGVYVALDGTNALVGTDLFSDLGGTWTQIQEFTQNDATDKQDFGTASALSGTAVLIGGDCYEGGPHPGECTGPGAAYFYGEGDLDLAVSAPATVAQGQTYESQAIATNDSSATSPAVVLSIAVPAAANFVSATASQGSCSAASGVVACDVGAIGGNAGTATATVKFKATGSVGTKIENAAGVARALPSLSASAATMIEEGPPPPPPPPPSGGGGGGGATGPFGLGLLGFVGLLAVLRRRR